MKKAGPTTGPAYRIPAKEGWDARDRSLAAMRRAVEEANVFVFTLGLTECWRSRESN
ncbi:MAG: GSCFA domain-containing protein, partial [Bacteroidota bacterium]